MISEALRQELRRTFANGNYEPTEDGGVLVPRAGLKISGVFANRVKRDGVWTPWEYDNNIFVNEGLNHVLGVTFSAVTPITTWYIGIFEANYTPLATDNAANIAANSTESTAYTEANRVTWAEGGEASQSITNSTTADFSINATKTMYGAFLVSSSTKSGTSGTLAAASKFAASRSVVNLDTLSITYTLTAADA
jgi:hypothetical protein